MSGSENSLATIIAEQIRIARLGAVYLAGYVAISTAVYSVLDIYYFEVDSLYFLTSFLVWGLGYVLLVQLMRVSSEPGEVQCGKIGVYFGICLLTGFAIGVGLVLLVLPGLYMMMRWLPAFARLYASEDGVVESMSWSWEHTADHQLPLAIAMIGPLLGYLVMFGIAVLQEFYYYEMGEALVTASFVVFNLAVSIAIAWFQLLGVAAYRVIRGDHSQQTETFA